jgi:alpha-amylase
MNSEQRYLNLYFQVHQPRRLKRFQFFDVGFGHNYFDDALNKEIVCRIASNCYLPANRLLLKLIEKYPAIKVTFSISGTALEQLEQYAPEVLLSFRELAETGSVEFLAETYYHSLSYFINREEFIEQIDLHRRKLKGVIGATPCYFRNTELIYCDGIGSTISELGFSGAYIDGVEKVLNGRTPNSLYRHPDEDLVLIPRNYRLSDDIAFRYSDENWEEWPLTGSKFESWLSSLPADQKLVCLAMDYETFGEHKKSTSGIFNFLEDFILAVVKHNQFVFANPSEIRRLLPAEQIISSDRAISWADEARDLSAWLGNDMQRDAFESLYRFQEFISSAGDTKLIDAYRHLQTGDHFYYMATKNGADGTVHQYFSPYSSPYEAFMNFMNIIADLELRIRNSMRVSNEATSRSTRTAKELNSVRG